MPIELSPAQATTEIRRRARDGSNVAFTDHGQDLAAHDINDQEVVECLRKGTVHSNPDFNMGHDDPVYRVVYPSKDGKKELITAVVICDPGTELLVVTRFYKKRFYSR